MRTVTGRTDKVVVVGAGLAGLAAAMHLAGSGRQVTVLEREPVPGGRAGVLRSAGFTFDTGPTVLTMPELIARPFAALGEELADWLELRRLRPSYRTFFPDGSSLDVLDDPSEMTDHVRKQLGPGAAAGYQRYADHVAQMYRLQFTDFMDRNFDSPLDALTPNLLRLALAGGFGRLDRQARRYLTDPRLLRAFTFQSMYAGVSPQRALALYSVISYMDCVAGVFVPVGGIHRLPTAMAAAAAGHGVEFRYRTAVERVEQRGRRATAVVTTAGDRIECDAVVLTPDLPVARAELLGMGRRRTLRLSPSAVVLLAGSSRDYPALAHHNIHFGRAWAATFTELIDRHRPMSDPSFFVGNLSRSDPELAPTGQHSYYVLFPAPNQRSGIEWDSRGQRYAEHMIDTMESRGYLGFGDSLSTSRLITPADWERQGMAGGTPFAAAHTLTQTGPFRPGNLLGDNIVFAGSGTVPGVGVPMVLISGRLAAERITG